MMKRTVLAAIAMTLSSSAFAAVSFEFGSTWFFPQLDPNSNTGNDYNYAGQGQTVAANWDLDNDLILGVYIEATELNNGNGQSEPFDVQALTVSKGVMKNASLGMHLGTFHETWFFGNDGTGMLTDLFGTITMISGGAEKISGSLKATVGARYANSDYNSGEGSFNGYFVSVAVGIGI
jgi:hypothetical protein